MSFPSKLFLAVKVAGATHRLLATGILIVILVAEAYRYGRERLRRRTLDH